MSNESVSRKSKFKNEKVNNTIQQSYLDVYYCHINTLILKLQKPWL